MNASSTKRITYKRARPNPLFQEWLEELYEEAKAKGSKLESMLKEALESLSKYPLPLQSGAECIILKGFEKRLCAHIDQRLDVYNQNLALARESSSSSSSQSTDVNTACSSPMSNIMNIENRSTQSKNSHSSPVVVNVECEVNKTVETNPINNSTSLGCAKKKGKENNYVPAHRSGAYAIIMAFIDDYIETLSDNSLLKDEIIDKAQRHAEESFIRPKPGTYYTAWSGMTTLVTKELVIKVTRNKEVRYKLSLKGMKLAKKLVEESKNIPSMNDIIFNDVPSTSTVGSSKDNNILKHVGPSLSQKGNNIVIDLLPGSFDIILLIDKNETSGVSKKKDPTVAQFNKYPDLKHEYRSLKVGDFTWIARHKVYTELELVLPYIVERKRMDDLGASIKDGRFHEQKFRLRKCGLKNVIYLIENYGSNKHVGLPLQSLMQALANTRIVDEFKVHLTDSLTNSARFLAMMTKRLTIRYKDKDLKGCSNDATEDLLMSFDYFNKASSKTKPLTVTETFIKLLLQLKGVSVEKALAITAEYNTPRSLIVKYQRCDRREGETLLAHLKYGDDGRKIGPAVSKFIYQLFSKLDTEV